jgi:hypothetical protein
MLSKNSFEHFFSTMSTIIKAQFFMCF